MMARVWMQIQFANGSTITIKNMIDNLTATPMNTEILRQGGMWELGNHERTIGQ
jgi:hypothetical protein